MNLSILRKGMEIYMNESYAEASVRQRATTKTYMIRALMVIGILVGLVVMTLGGFFGILGAAGIVLICYLFPRLNLIYEYIYCDGQLDFDKIMGGAKRKQVLRIDFEQVEILAKANSHALDGYTYVQLDVKDFSSKNKDVIPYVLVVSVGERKTKILFEPNEKMINVIKQKYPRKVSMV